MFINEGIKNLKKIFSYKLFKGSVSPDLRVVFFHVWIYLGPFKMVFNFFCCAFDFIFKVKVGTRLMRKARHFNFKYKIEGATEKIKNHQRFLYTVGLDLSLHDKNDPKNRVRHSL